MRILTTTECALLARGGSSVRTSCALRWNDAEKKMEQGLVTSSNFLRTKGGERVTPPFLTFPGTVLIRVGE